MSLILYRLHYFWCVLWAAIITVVCSVFFLVTRLFWRSPESFRFWGKIWAGVICLGAGFRVTTSGMKDLETDRSYVFVANHQNSLDIPIMLLAVPVAFGFVAKASVERMPFIGRAVASSPSVFVDTQNPRRSLESIRIAADQIAKGASVLVFPEGQRSWSGQVGKFKRSAFTLATEAGVEIVPLALLNAHMIFDERRYLSRPGTIHVSALEALEPVPDERASIDELSAEARSRIISVLSTDQRVGPAIADRFPGTPRDPDI
ncbi:MAG: 1-acyl-sn-glycerol-3-phosphate acyltransferase [Rhodothermales bacterium]|nr:1-acyl-sn-glycerol-3-phosphate acyltransferase [Rhodothermales bacterium]